MQAPGPPGPRSKQGTPMSNTRNQPRRRRGTSIAAGLGLVLALPLMVLAQTQFAYVSSWPANGGSAAPDFRRQEVMGVAADSQGRIYVSHATRNPILVFNSAGAYLGSWGGAILHMAHSVRVDPQGNV